MQRVDPTLGMFRAGGGAPVSRRPTHTWSDHASRPQGTEAPRRCLGNAVHVMKVLTGEIVEEGSPMPNRAKGGKIGGKRRAEALSPEQRSEIARKAAASRWSMKG